MKSLWRKLVDSIKESQFFDDSDRRRTDPNSKYACFFTAAWSYFRNRNGLKLSWDDYKAACLKAKAIREDFYLLDRDAMATAAGVNAKCIDEGGAGIAARALQLITLGKTCLMSLNGEHYESIVGVEKYEDDSGADRLRFLIEDPGAQGDTFADYDDLIVYHEGDGGQRIYSKSHNGSKRKITRLFWWVG